VTGHRDSDRRQRGPIVINGWAGVILQGVIVAALAWMGTEAIAQRDFRIKGDRFTKDQGSDIVRRMGLIEQSMSYILLELNEHDREDRRLQVQIDRLEGHDTRGYAPE
jgi:hypothetical protein